MILKQCCISLSSKLKKYAVENILKFPKPVLKYYI